MSPNFWESQHVKVIAIFLAVLISAIILSTTFYFLGKKMGANIPVDSRLRPSYSQPVTPSPAKTKLPTGNTPSSVAPVSDSTPAPVGVPEKETPAVGVELKDVPTIALPSFTVEWLAQPEELKNITLVENSVDGFYFKMGNTSTGDEVIYRTEWNGTPYLYRFLKTPGGKYVFLEAQSNSPTGGFLNEKLLLTGMLARDLKTKIPGIDAPEKFEYAGVSWEHVSGFFSGDTMLTNPESEKPNNFIAKLSFGDLFSKEKRSEESNDLGGVTYFVHMADGLFVNYTMDDSRADDGTLIAEWKSKYAKYTTQSFTQGIRGDGCGSGTDNRYYPKEGEVENLLNVGTLRSGGQLFLVSNPNNAILERLFSMAVPHSKTPDMSRAEFASHVTILLTPDPLGRGYMFYQFTDETGPASMVECGKPVIYLYPEKTTDVSVKVGANITKSEPEYGSGWNVTAKPDGTLRDEQGKTWGSLFWDGTGFGEYPAIREGRVVSRSEIQKALTNDLQQLGLNDREIGEFLEFWLPKMPDTSFVRLTWFMTDDMDTLAPLSVSPRPDTTIRVFLDFSGQETPSTDLLPQTLTTIPRKGFTLVEWGGLLRTTKTRP